MNKNPKHYFIVVDENTRPMAWGGDQFCYTDDEAYRSRKHVLTMYTRGRAEKFIERHNEYRNKNNLPKDALQLMPIKLPVKFQPYNK